MAVKQEDDVFRMENEPEESRQAIMGHYALFLQYYWAEGPLSRAALVHYIFLDCVISPQEIAVYKGKVKTLSNKTVFEKTYFDYTHVLGAEPKAKEYALAKVNEILNKLIPQKLIKEKKLASFLKALVPTDINLEMAWDLSLQNLAKAKGEFRKRLLLAVQSEELKNMPEPIREINEYHLKELLMMYRLESRCPECAWEMPCLGGIALFKGGDEEVLNYLQCENCAKYFVQEYSEGLREAEPGYAESECFREVEAKQAEKDLAAIKKCPDSYNKHCKCKSHVDYFDSGS